MLLVSVDAAKVIQTSARVGTPDRTTASRLARACHTRKGIWASQPPQQSQPRKHQCLLAVHQRGIRCVKREVSASDNRRMAANSTRFLAPPPVTNTDDPGGTSRTTDHAVYSTAVAKDIFKTVQHQRPLRERPNVCLEPFATQTLRRWVFGDEARRSTAP